MEARNADAAAPDRDGRVGGGGFEVIEGALERINNNHETAAPGTVTREA